MGPNQAIYTVPQVHKRSYQWCAQTFFWGGVVGAQWGKKGALCALCWLP